MSKPNVTLERLRGVLAYDQGTGVFTWRVRTALCIQVGDVAGCLSAHDGYVYISIDGKLYRAHRLAWFHVHGEWPENDVDHRDTVRSHNWIDNLRPATRAQNMQNIRDISSRNKSGYRGVHWDKRRGKWVARLRLNGRQIYLGASNDPAIAGALHLQGKVKHHPYQTLVPA